MKASVTSTWPSIKADKKKTLEQSHNALQLQYESTSYVDLSGKPAKRMRQK